MGDAGRALRKRTGAVLLSTVVDCSGDFLAGDRVHVVMRAKDGGQYVIATGIVRHDAAKLRQLTHRSISTRTAPTAPTTSDDGEVVITEQDLKMIWPSKAAT